MPHQHRIRFALKTASAHLGVNILVAAAVAALIFWVWYPFPYHQLMGSLDLMWLIIAVDVVCGPVLTLVLADPRKRRAVLLRDLSWVVLIQLAALVYGIHTVAVVRPVVVVFEQDRFNVVSALEVQQEELASAPAGLQSLSWSGPKRIALREAQDLKERDTTLDLSLQGIEPSMRPSRWLPDNEATHTAIRAKMQPLGKLLARYPNDADLQVAVAASGLPENRLYYLPLTSWKNKDWTVLLDEDTQFRGFVPLDAFF
ncbi:hypothetical protein L1281_002413 [Neisseria sp. HSC-16F19]|nr:TfpX/TfpZ family type IV pilin accessory protein [Neisseria sp. HSC-16F19]MCP2041796.1 hypothetical protein [Neisseria sp. HSC-16F19]